MIVSREARARVAGNLFDDKNMRKLLVVTLLSGVAGIGSAASGSGATLQVSSSTLRFIASAGGESPAPQILTVTPAGSGSSTFSVQLDGGSTGTAAPAFLGVEPMSGTAPASLTVTATTGSLTAGIYRGRILISNLADTSQAPIPVAVTFAVAPAKPHLTASPNRVRFQASAQAATTQNQLLVLGNSGGGGPLNFSIIVAGRSPWISVSPATGTISPNAPASVTVIVNSQGLASGNYRDALHISTAAGLVSVPVALFVASSGPVLGLDLHGMTFRGRQGNGVPSLDPVEIFNDGDAGTLVHWTAELLTGTEWLSLGSTSGTSSPGNSSQLPLQPTAAITTLPAGTLFALVKVSDPGSQNSPQFVSVVLDLAPAGSPANPDPAPQGLFFVAAAGGTPPASQATFAIVSSAAPLPFQASTMTNDGAPWLSETTSSTTTTLANPAQLNVSVNPANLAPGIYTGVVQVVIGELLRSVNVTLVVTPRNSSNSNPSASRLETAQASGCAPTQIVITQVGTVNNFSLPASYPTELQVQLNDDCGNPIADGQVVASFSNGDPTLSLPPDTPPGTYSAVWQPGVVSAQTAITETATAGSLQPATSKLLGGVTATANPAPELVAAGTLNNLNPLVGAALAPGTIAQVYGSNLASAMATADSVPLPGTMNGTQILIGGVVAPIYYLSGTQMVVQIPTELAAGHQYSVISIVNGALSLPDTLSLASTDPGVAAYADGTIIAQHIDFTLVSSTSPAHPGEALIMYLAGMGSTTSPVASGTAAPSNPPASATVQPTVQVGGQNAQILYAGLTPGGVGLYQIDFVVPASAKAGTLDVEVTQGGVRSNIAQLPVAQ